MLGVMRAMKRLCEWMFEGDLISAVSLWTILPEERPKVSPGSVFNDLKDRKRPLSVLEVGTSQVVPGRSTHWRASFPWIADDAYIRLDLKEGPDVDVVERPS